MRNTFIIMLILIVALAGHITSFCQDIPPQYLTEALHNNLVVKQKNVSLQKSLTTLKEARSLFLPVTWFEGQYTLAKGGRSIDIPVGTLLNPVYSSLNQLAGQDKFPMINNVSEQLNPDNFYDLRIKTTLPVINSDLRINRDIKEQQTHLQQYETDIYKRELVKDVKTAWFNYLMSTKAINIYENALDVVNQNLRVNRSLLANGKGLPAYVSRAEAEVKQVETQWQNALNEQKNAAFYFNFLLNRPINTEIVLPDSSNNELTLSYLSDTLHNVSGREELKSIALARDINKNVFKMNKSFRVPKLNVFLDLGTQAFDLDFNRKTFFYLGGIQLKVPIFSGNSNVHRISQTELDAKALQLNSDHTRNQLELSASISSNNINTAYNAYQSLMKQEESAHKYFNLIDRGFKEGINSFIEFLDARNQLTTVQLQRNIQYYKVLVAIADYERQTASYSF